MRKAFKPTRRGMTLVELMIVIGIAVTLIVIAAPLMRPQLKDRKLREASRQLNTIFASAKAKAARLNRPAGIIIKRDVTAGRNQGAYEIYLAETPIPYAGDAIGAKATLTDIDANGFAHGATFSDPQQLVTTGDTIQFNYMGPKYRVTVVSPGTITFSSPSGLPLPRAASSPPTQLPFQVTRQPQVASDDPLELPPNTVIDLQWSGVGKSGNEMDNTNPAIVIMFNPTGSVSTVSGFSFTTPGTIHLLVGRTDQLTALQDNPTDLTKSNLLDPTVSWVSIGHLTGTITTAENYVVDPVTMSAAATAAQITSSREIATNKQTMGGR